MPFLSLTRKHFLSFLLLFSLSIHFSTTLRRVFLICSTAFVSHFHVDCSMLYVSSLPPKFSIYIQMLTILFLRIFHFSPRLNFRPYACLPHRTHDLRSGSQDHHPSKNSVQKTICCNSTFKAPDDGRMYPKHVELRVHQ